MSRTKLFWKEKSPSGIDFFPIVSFRINIKTVSAAFSPRKKQISQPHTPTLQKMRSKKKCFYKNCDQTQPMLATVLSALNSEWVVWHASYASSAYNVSVPVIFEFSLIYVFFLGGGGWKLFFNSIFYCKQ